jgi:hypothetical protein
VGAAGDNGVCSVGVAPQTIMSSCNAFSLSEEPFLAVKIDAFDISQNSYGTNGCLFQFERRELQATCPFSFTVTDNQFHPCNVCDLLMALNSSVLGADNLDEPLLFEL